MGQVDASRALRAHPRAEGARPPRPPPPTLPAAAASPLPTLLRPLLSDAAAPPAVQLESTSGIPIDVTIAATPQHTGLLARDLVMGYLEEAPQLAPLVVVLKSYLRDYNLNDPYTGGLSSYCLVVLLYNFVRETHQCGYLTHDCGYLLVGFLTMFLYRFEQNNQGMATMQHVDDPLVPTTYNDQGMVALGDNIMHSCYQVLTRHTDPTPTPPPRPSASPL